MEVLQELSLVTYGILALLVVLAYLMFRSSTTNYDFFKKLGIPYVIPAPFIGSTLENIKKPLHDIEYERCMKYGSLHGFFDGRTPVLTIADPRLVRDILVKDFHFFTERVNWKTGDGIVGKLLIVLGGEAWKRVRSIVSPVFSIGKVKQMMGVFESCSSELVKTFRTYAQKAEPVELKQVYSAFTMDVIARACFSTKIDSHNDPNNEFVLSVGKVFQKNINYRYVLYCLCPRLMQLLGISLFPPSGIGFFKNVTLELIKNRRQTGQTRNDFLQLLMDSSNDKMQDEGTEDTGNTLRNNEGECNSRALKNYKPKDKSLTSDELVAQCVTFFVGGTESSASTLAFVTYYLALNTDVQEKLLKELKETIGASNGELTYEGVQSMKYMDRVISETLRLNPSVIRLKRTPTNDYPLGDTGIVIPKGTNIIIPVYAIHRYPEHYPDPEIFNPDRFTKEVQTGRDPYTYMPFGAGPRNCVAKNFALLEMKVCIAYIVRNFQIKRCSRTKVPLQYHRGRNMLHPIGATVLLEEREDSFFQS